MSSLRGQGLLSKNNTRVGSPNIYKRYNLIPSDNRSNRGTRHKYEDSGEFILLGDI